MYQGKIKSKVGDRGFGFIKAGDGVEYFFHFSACGDRVDAKDNFDALDVNDKVTFDIGTGSDKGPRAENVRAL